MFIEIQKLTSDDVGVYNKTSITRLEPVQDLYNYRFYHLPTSYNSIVLSN